MAAVVHNIGLSVPLLNTDCHHFDRKPLHLDAVAGALVYAFGWWGNAVLLNLLSC